jgi:hypothetical protein
LCVDFFSDGSSEILDTLAQPGDDTARAWWQSPAERESSMSRQAPDVPSSADEPTNPLSASEAILAGGLLAGALDITYACIVLSFRDISPIGVGQSVASGLLGREAAVAGGIRTGLLGFVLHFGMALIMAAAYFAAATRLPALAKRAVLFGPLYGLGLYLVMNHIVLPLSAIGRHGGNGPWYLVSAEILVHMFFVGLTIALFTRRALATAWPDAGMGAR